ncbi:uncharacterized protein BcabD6B2_45490 [Babesia caballi]|uniref:Uncharacterized protein n=1 Tax=Babesia caballi TaxID=5871 RepID=A0AAV4M2Q9_BABCB|nr:hypothetical protein, conserved [Babesia caballi]
MLLLQEIASPTPGTFYAYRQLFRVRREALLLPRTRRWVQLCQSQHFASTASQDVPTGGSRIHDYLKEKKLTVFHSIGLEEPKERLYNGIRSTLASLSGTTTLDFDLLDERTSRVSSSVEDLVLSAPKYPKVSFFSDGYVNVSLAKRGLYGDFIRDAREFRGEEVTFSSRLYPMRRSRGRMKEKTEIQQLQRSLDTNLCDMIAFYTPSDLVKLLRQMYLLDLSIRVSNLAEISKKFLKGISSLHLNELGETAFLVISYMDHNFESGRLLLAAIGSRLEKRIDSLVELSGVEIINLMLPIVQIQIRFPRNTWTVLTNGELLNRLVTSASLLDTNGAAELFTLLTVSNSIVPLSGDTLDARRSIAARLDGDLCDITNRTMHRLLSVSGMFEADFPTLSCSLYRNALRRTQSLRPTVLASVYLKMNSKNEVLKHFQNTIGRRFVEISTAVLIDLYCNFLREGQRNVRQLRVFERAFARKRQTLSLRDMSNILMYHSMYGTSISQLNEVIKTRFAEIKRLGEVKHDELLDVVLSMSLVGLHNGLGVWTGVDLPHLVYSTPTNILVYLGYAFLITGERNRGIWTTMLERMLYESKTHSHEIYEVLKVAKVFGIVSDDMDAHLLSRASWVLQHTKSQHNAKVSRRRYQSPAPIEDALHLIGLQYAKGVMIQELYEAPFYIASHDIILDPLRESYLHAVRLLLKAPNIMQTTGLEVGEVHLRHRVWHKQGYHPFPLNEPALRRFQGTENKEWNVPELADFICKVIKLENYSPLNGTGRLNVLRTRNTRRQSKKLIAKQPARRNAPEGKIRRLQKMLLDKNTKRK